MQRPRSNAAARNPERTRRAKGPSETQIARAIVDALEANGYRVRRQQSGRIQLRHGGWMHLGDKGWPDWLVWAPVVGLLEIKRPGESLTAEQELTHQQLVDAGWRIGVAHCVTEALEIVRGWGRWAT